MLLELILEDAPSYEERCSAFGRFLQEKSIALPAHLEALLVVAQYYARCIVTQKFSPHEGARKIWFEICNELEEPSELLRCFVSAASELEDLPVLERSRHSIIEQLEAEIRAYAQQLLSVQEPEELKKRATS